VNNNIARLVLKNDTKMATAAAPTGNNMRIFACSFSVLVNEVFSIVLELITYRRILNIVRPIKIMFKAKKIIAVLE
jgi:hypothetical protein